MGLFELSLSRLIRHMASPSGQTPLRILTPTSSNWSYLGFVNASATMSRASWAVWAVLRSIRCVARAFSFEWTCQSIKLYMSAACSVVSTHRSKPFVSAVDDLGCALDRGCRDLLDDPIFNQDMILAFRMTDELYVLEHYRGLKTHPITHGAVMTGGAILLGVVLTCK
jgi:hypothetical protein